MNTEINAEFKVAAEFVLQTSQNLFLTGKAGTGKTTFLKYILSQTIKNTVVVAPTGVAAINAGGVTMHSFFQLPFSPFIPEVAHFGSAMRDTVDPHSLFETVRFNTSRIKLYKSLQLLIIDEVSMLRADLLDCIDTVLRRFRKSQLPFGGVQVLFIGDLFQLPPIAREWDLLKDYYETPFFFSARVLKNNPPMYIELKKIYRQNEMRFIQLLNRLRNNELTEDDFELLQERYDANQMIDRDDYITLTTHNSKAEKVNTSELQQIDATAYSFEAEVKGDFPETMFPMETTLTLKQGAQVMYIKNDSDLSKRYFNGKLGTVKRINENSIVVISKDDQSELEVPKETWENKKYKLDLTTNKIEEEVVGRFMHYPLRLAWAITIHKSQGLTFQKAIIDAGQSFAAGQVYVALSRCVSLNGIILQSRILPHAVRTDERILEFEASQKSIDTIAASLEEEKRKYRQTFLMQAFDWNGIELSIHELAELMGAQSVTDTAASLPLLQSFKSKLNRHRELLIKLELKLQTAINQQRDTDLIDLMQRAIPYFCKSLKEEWIQPINEYLQEQSLKSKSKGYVKKMIPIAKVWELKIAELENLDYEGIRFYSGASFIDTNTILNEPIKTIEKLPKGATFKETLYQFLAGKSIPEISKERNLAPGTVEGHLVKLVASKDLDIHLFLTDEQIQLIAETARRADTDKVTPIVELLNGTFSFYQVKMALQFVSEKREHI